MNATLVTTVIHPRHAARRSYFVAAFALLAAALHGLVAPVLAQQMKSPGRPPNILLILVDDLGYGDLACYGAKDLQTPNLDRLAGEGMRFNYFRANSCVCSPTRAAILTGRVPDRAGVPGVIRTHPENSWGRLSPQVLLLPQVLKPAGYHSAIVGKWHLGLEGADTPIARGFDVFRGFLGDMMDDYWTHLRHGNQYMRDGERTIDPKGHATDLFTQWASGYLRDRAAMSDRPFFLYLAYNAPHDPIQPPPEWLEKVRRRLPDLPEKRAKLVALIEHLDDGIGRVLATLHDTGVEQNTLVIFTSDNGGSLPAGASNGATRDGKGSMYEGGLRVPMFARWPGRIAAGTRSSAAAVSADLFATVLEAAHVPSVPRIDGVSLLGLLLGQAQTLPARELYFVRREGGFAYGGKTIEALIRNDWKLLQNSPFGPYELYNLKDDPLEEKNLAASHRRVLGEMSAAMRLHIQRGGRVPWQAPQD